MDKYNIVDANIEHVAQQIVNDFHDMIKILLTEDRIFLENDKLMYRPTESLPCYVCTCIHHNFWKECIEYHKDNSGIMKQVIPEHTKEEAKQYIIKSINEIIKIHNERSN